MLVLTGPLGALLHAPRVLPELAAEAEGWPAVQRVVEEAVLDLIAADESSDAVERAA